ncbi:hypothetical protein N665_1112s0001 [Sinapis alba]|nr:hypothetical protein N665_1112s0001 [Sinapis alba]
MRFIKDFSKIARPLTALLCKELSFDFTPDCLKTFEEIKTALATVPIVQAPDKNFPFEIVCDASDFAIGAVLGQKKDKKLHVIYYSRITLDNKQRNYATTENEVEDDVPIDDFLPTEKVYKVNSKLISSIHMTSDTILIGTNATSINFPSTEETIDNDESIGRQPSLTEPTSLDN